MGDMKATVWSAIQGPLDALAKGFDDPRRLFQCWQQEVSAKCQPPTASHIAILATSAGDNLASAPSQRPVQILHSNSDGEFYMLSIDSSRKVQQLRTNPRVSLLYDWVQFGRYVSIEGSAGIVPDRQLTADLFASNFTPAIRASFAAVGDQQSRPISAQQAAGIGSVAAALLGKADSTPALQPPDSMVLIKVTPDYYEFYQAGAGACDCAVRLAYCQQSAGASGDAAVDNLVTFAASGDWRVRQLCP